MRWKCPLSFFLSSWINKSELGSWDHYVALAGWFFVMLVVVGVTIMSPRRTRSCNGWPVVFVLACRMLLLQKFTQSHIAANKGSVTMVNDKLLVEQSF